MTHHTTHQVHAGHAHRHGGGRHTHGPACGHEAVPHTGHTDYLVDGRLHQDHGNHCDDHGKVATA